MRSWIERNHSHVTDLYNRLRREHEKINSMASQVCASSEEESPRGGAAASRVPARLAAEQMEAATRHRLTFDALFATLLVYQSQRMGLDLPGSDETPQHGVETLQDWLETRFEPLFESFLAQEEIS